MCVDFTYLNEACPNASFSLPQINFFVNSIVGHELLSSMDAFSSYNQIKMVKANREKTSLITDRGFTAMTSCHLG
jgi:hypothetical protein